MSKTVLSNGVQSTADPGGDVQRGELFRAGTAGGPARAARVRARVSAGTGEGVWNTKLAK